MPSGTGTGNNALAFITTDASGTISGTWITAGNEGDWSGFQIATSAVPEPSSLTHLGVGSLGLVGYVWRRRRAVAA